MSTFKPLPDPFGDNDDYNDDLPDAKPLCSMLVELEMARLSTVLRAKPSWWTKFRDPEILARWWSEALAQASLMREQHVDYVLQELDGYANLRDEDSGAEVSCYDRIWQSDRLVPAAVREDLIAGVAKLENVPETEKDWHPRSNGQVLDLVHPSLYPLVYGRTLSYPVGSTERDAKDLAARCEPPYPQRRYGQYYFISDNFQWLPTDFKVSDDARSVKSLGYINNLHPTEHAGLHGTIERLVATYIPLFERTLTDSLPQNTVIPQRTSESYEDEEDPAKPTSEKYENDRNEYWRRYEEWKKTRAIIPPELRNPDGYETGSLENREIKYTLAGRTIQVIVKLANIHLTPDRPEYPGGSWHVEGMKNESIAVSGIYYYAEDNITESRLAFRTAVNGPEDYEQDDDRACRVVWGIGRDQPCVNELGSVVTSQHRCIAFPNLYQHRVLLFELADKTKPGYRKIVALFLVDPAVNIPSTTVVPPQQQEWRAAAVASNAALKTALGKLSSELIDRINNLADGTMTREEAGKYRLKLMDERTAFVHENNDQFFNVGFSMCEH